MLVAQLVAFPLAKHTIEDFFFCLNAGWGKGLNITFFFYFFSFFGWNDDDHQIIIKSVVYLRLNETIAIMIKWMGVVRRVGYGGGRGGGKGRGCKLKYVTEEFNVVVVVVWSSHPVWILPEWADNGDIKMYNNKYKSAATRFGFLCTFGYGLNWTRWKWYLKDVTHVLNDVSDASYWAVCSSA